MQNDGCDYIMFTEIGVKSKRMDVIISSNVYEDRC